MNRLAILMLTTAVSNAAFSDTNYYLDLSGGYLFSLQNSTVTDNSNRLSWTPDGVNIGLFQAQNVTWKNHYRDGFDGGLTFGVKFDHWRWDGEFLYQNVQRDINGYANVVQLDSDGGDVFAPAFASFDDSENRLWVYSLLFNVYYDFKIDSHWNPFIGGGVGAAIVDSESTSENSTILLNNTTDDTTSTINLIQKSPTISGTPFAWQLKGGLTYIVNENFSIVGLYRLFGTTSLSSGSSTMIANPNTVSPTTFYIKGQEVKGLLLNSFELGLRYVF